MTPAHPHVSSPSADAGRLRRALTDDPRDRLRRRLASIGGRRRLDDVVRALAADLLSEEAVRSAPDRAWLRRALDRAAREAAEDALNVLLDEVAEALRTEPARVAAVLAVRPEVRRLDFE